jgi:tetrahydromethanopterin S-methyltransferase subunit H
MAVPKDWAADVKNYVPDADEKAIDGIVKYCGIALQNQDSSLVSFTDPAEVARVRENFLKKKLGLNSGEGELDAAMAQVRDRMKDDRTKNRVTVYYLLAQQFGKLSAFT